MSIDFFNYNKVLNNNNNKNDKVKFQLNDNNNNNTVKELEFEFVLFDDTIQFKLFSKLNKNNFLY